MKLLAKIMLVGAIAGAGATMYAAPSIEGGGYASYDVARADRIRSETSADFSHVLRLQAIARRARDVIKLNCVNDKLVQIKAQMNVADRLQLDLQVQSADSIGTFESLTAAANTIHNLRNAADECIGEQLLSTESSNQWAHPDIPDNPGLNTWGVGEIEPPAYASPID